MLLRSLALACLLLSLPAIASADKKTERQQQYKDQVQPLVKKYCFECHGDGNSEGDFNLDKYDTAQRVLVGRKHWLKVLRRVTNADMPPKDADKRPTKEEYALIAKFLEGTLNELDCSEPPVAGHVTLRRLTRYEYRNTIRDLYGIDYEPAKNFPADEVGYGFDNIGDVLSLPPLLLEKYLFAAEEITRKAIITEAPSPKMVAEVRGSRFDGAGNREGRGDRMFATNGEASTTIDVLLEGDYRIRITGNAEQAGDEKSKLALKIDDKEVRVFEFQEHKVREQHTYETRLTAGKHKFTLGFTNNLSDPSLPEGRRDRNIYLNQLDVFGPNNDPRESLPAIHKKLITVVPNDKISWEEAAKKNLEPMVTRAFRRPATESEVKRLAQVVEIAKANGDNFETGMQLALQAMLASPHFLFKVEASPEPGSNPDADRLLNDYELATRLSYFLWSTMPDDELFRLAKEGQLSKADVLEQQTRRMLKDDRSQALVQNFATQWLTLRNLDNVQPNARQFRQFNQGLRDAMRTETEMFVGAVIKEDLSILKFLDADFTYMNQQLAGLYGIPNVQGNEFRKVSLAGTSRGGLLTHASILTVTSNPGRTSPVKRGKWILENMLNEPPPPPPPNVPELKEVRAFEATDTLKERMKKHRADPVCNSCHQVMDSLGFALENYDAIGTFRVKEGQLDIEAVGEFPSGEKVTGAVELRKHLLSTKRKEFVGCLSEKMLTYALGRGLEYYDLCTIDKIRTELEKNDHRFSTLVVEIVRSYPFQHQGVKRSE